MAKLKRQTALNNDRAILDFADTNFVDLLKFK